MERREQEFSPWSSMFFVSVLYSVCYYLRTCCLKLFVMSTDTPIVNALSQQDIIEGRDLSVACTTTPGNPRATQLC